MCGVAGYIGEPIRDDGFIRRLLVEMKTRGRDGFGFLTYKPDEEESTVTYKQASEVSPEKLNKTPGFEGATAVLMHTRQATSGTKGPVDCHPLTHKKVTVVHNGVVTGHERIRKDLGIPGNTPQVDSFLIAWILGEAKSIPEGIETVFKTLPGSLTFLVFSARSPLTIWAASNNGVLHQFKHKGQDYLCSTERIFDEALTQKVGKKLKRGGYRAFGPMNGVWELSPYRFKQIITAQEIVKMEPAWGNWQTTVYMGEEWQDTREKGKTKIKAFLPRGKVKPNPYLVPREEREKFQVTPYVRPLEAVAVDYAKLCRKQLMTEAQNEIFMEGLTLELMPHVVHALDAGIIKMLEEEPAVNCLLECGRRARVLLPDEGQNLCWTCAAVFSEWSREKSTGKELEVH